MKRVTGVLAQDVEERKEALLVGAMFAAPLLEKTYAKSGWRRRSSSVYSAKLRTRAVDVRQKCPLQVSALARSMPPFMAMEVFERATKLEREGRSIVHLEIGEPDWDTPKSVTEAGIKALREGQTHYTHSLGRMELREAIAAWYSRQYQLALDPGRVIVTVGSSGAMLLVFAALLDSGMEVLLTDPHYPCYPKFITAFGGVPVNVPIHEENNFQYDPSVVQRKMGTRTRALIINSPSNPTGVVTGPEGLRELVSAVGDRAWIVSDEAYHGLVYHGRAHSILEYCPRAVVINGFSKLFAMTGWRLGYAIVPESLVRPIQKLQQNLFISPADFAQTAAIVAMTTGNREIEERRQRYDGRRRLVLLRLKEMGLRVLAEPTGAFYVFVNIREYSKESLPFAFQLLERNGVAVTPGIDFGSNGEGFIRISYANSTDQLEEGMRRLAEFLSERAKQ